MMAVTVRMKRFFKAYERTIIAQDFKNTVKSFADPFILAGPRGAIAMNKSGFLELSRQAVELYKNAGRTSVKILSMDETPITDAYALVKTHWGLTFRKTGDKIIESDITFLVQKTGPEPKIVAFIDHQDDETMYKQLGIIST